MQRSLSVIISAYNEQENLRAAVTSINTIIAPLFTDYEFLIFDDGSHDQSGVIADQLAAQNPYVRVIHNPGNRGLSYNAREGIRLAQKEYLTWFPGDNSIDQESMRAVIKVIGTADIIVAYMANGECRSMGRRVLSGLFTAVLNCLFGLNLKYYNGPTVYPTAVLKSLKLVSNGYEFFAELLVRALKSGQFTYVQVPFVHNVESGRNSRALSFKNLKSVLCTIVILFRDIYVAKIKTNPSSRPL